jgi:hypothetical protein
MDCIVPTYGNRIQPAAPIWGRPPPYIRAWAEMLDPEAIRGLGQTMHRYVDMSTLNNRFRYAHLAGVGGTGAGSLGGSALGNAGLGAAPPNNVCLYMQYECQHWGEYPPETQAEIIKVANAAAQAHAYTLEQAKAGALELADTAENEAMLAQNTASASVSASEAAFKAAEKCDKEIMEELILQSDNYHGMAADHAQESGDAASQVYKIAGTGYLAQDETIMAAVGKSSAAASGAHNAVSQSEGVRQQVIAAARAKLGQCGGELPLPPPDQPGKVGVQRAGLLWLGLAAVAAAGVWQIAKKRK